MHVNIKHYFSNGTCNNDPKCENQTRVSDPAEHQKVTSQSSQKIKLGLAGQHKSGYP